MTFLYNHYNLTYLCLDIRATTPEYVADYYTNFVKKGYKMCHFLQDQKRRKIWTIRR